MARVALAARVAVVVQEAQVVVAVQPCAVVPQLMGRLERRMHPLAPARKVVVVRAAPVGHVVLVAVAGESRCLRLRPLPMAQPSKDTFWHRGTDTCRSVQ